MLCSWQLAQEEKQRLILKLFQKTVERIGVVSEKKNYRRALQISLWLLWN